MTQFVDVEAISRMVRTKGLVEVIEGMEKLMTEDFSHWQDFDKCPRVASHSDIGVIELMPVANASQYAFKYVNGHPSNAKRGFPTVMAFGALADVETGYPKLLAELTLTTAMRTATASLMAARYLARSDSKVMGMIGCGAQSEFQAIAFHKLLGIKEIRLFDIDKNAMSKLARHLGEFPELRVIPAVSAKAAVAGADIVTTCTADKKWATILTDDMVEPGMHINAIGGDCPGKTELQKEILLRAKTFVEFEPQSRIEGEIQQMDAGYPVTELWQVIRGQLAGRDSAEEITLFDSVGFALEDYSALRYIKQLAEELGEGETINLIPKLRDQKNLYGKLMTKPCSNVRSASGYCQVAS